ncbi:MAG: hypothetical protein EOM06_02915, partial [Sphingobacteriia bacterium]|nr:hypothetical protein [Sphingobacteriia bacterium]
MKKVHFIIVLLFLTISFSAKADEGMWLPLFIERLNYSDMQEKGLKLTAEEIYSINHSSLKDAIIIFGRGCTGEIVSDKGLIFTNHHCAYDIIQNHSSIQNDYLTDGFWAMSLKEELSNPGITASILVRMEDLTEVVMSELTEDMTAEERSAKVREITNPIRDEASEEGKYDAIVKSFYNGSEYYLFVYETYKDVRLVGAPPSSIGKYGGDTDNWMWPRHTGDFAVLRIYTAPDGTPAEYSEENIPLRPRHHLPISLKGYDRNDYAMIWGFPGSTERYLTSNGIEFAIAQVKGHEIQEGFLVSGMLIPMIVPIDTPLWMIAVATAFAVVFAKEVFGGTGYNIFNVALVTRAFLFFAYPAAMSGEKVFVRTDSTFGLGAGNIIDGFSGATPLGQVATATTSDAHMTGILGNSLSSFDMFLGLIPGSIGETSVLAILLGAVILIWTGIGSWKTILSVFVGGAFMAAIFNLIGTTAAMNVSPLDHLLLGGFAFGAVFMATDYATSPMNPRGMLVYGVGIGVITVVIRAYGAYPEGVSFAILI